MNDAAATRQAFEAMAEIFYAGTTYDDVYDSICRTARELVTGCDHASLMIRRGRRVRTVGASDDTARRIDEFEVELNEGPCLDAITDDVAHVCADLSSGSQWPKLALQVSKETSVRSMAGFRIVLDGEKRGALNLFGDTAGALSGESLDQGAMMAAFASVAMLAVDRGEEASTLRHGLESNREIGKALGLLMATHHVNDEEAFALLSRLSQEMNIKLANVAARLVAHHNTGEIQPR